VIAGDSPIRVLIVDDSALMRKLLTQMLASEPGIRVIDAVPDPIVARQRIKAANPDVLTLDIEMPKMDGLAFLERVMALRPMPVVMVSSLTRKGADATLAALELGAVDFVAKPLIDLERGLVAMRDELVAKVKAAARANVRQRRVMGGPPSPARIAPRLGYASTEKIVAIGASTGGVEALSELFGALPADCPAILVTQHMPAKFTASFAARLDRHCAMAVSEARDGARVLPGHVYIAPGGVQLELARSGADYVCRVYEGPPVSGHCPSVDVLFGSTARVAGANAIGVILTGMGRDGALGLRAMRDAGASTIGQDERSSVVYGMPAAAKANGAVVTELPLNEIPSAILHLCERQRGMNVRI